MAASTNQRCAFGVARQLAAACAIYATTVSAYAGSPFETDARLAVRGRVAFTEGPAWHPNGNVYFTDIANNRIMRRAPNGEVVVYRSPSGRSNGLMFDAQLRLHCCEGGGPEGNRRVTRIENDGTTTVMADRYDGKRLNSPNDLVIDACGRVYFSDPRYGDTSDVEQRDEDGTIVEGVYRIDAPGQIVRVIAHEVDRPNGLGIAPDGKFLYVADNVNTGPNAVGGNRKLWRFALDDDGNVQTDSRTLLFDWGSDRGPDGMTLDVEGNLYVAAGFNFPNLPAETIKQHRAGIYVLSPLGELIDFLPVPADMITNCTFGGDDRKTLFITAGHKLWSIPTNVAGYSHAVP